MLNLTVAKVQKKKFWIIFSSVLALIVVGAAAGAGIILTNLKKAAGANIFAENPHGFVKLSVRPAAERSIFTENFGSMSASELKAAALSMYVNAGINFKTHTVTVYDNCLSSFSVLGIKNTVNIDSVIMKNDDEYFRVDYRLKNDTPFLDMFKSFEKQINDGLELVLTERLYATKAGEAMLYHKVRNARLDDDKVPYAVWDDPDYEVFVEEREKPIFSSSQEGGYALTAHTVDMDTIASASAEYMKSEGYYDVTIVLDVNNPATSESAVENIREGSGDPNANFDKLEINFTVWDNGYIRTFRMEESWEANALGVEVLKFASVFNYNMYFSYAEEDCKLHEYRDYLDMMEYIAA